MKTDISTQQIQRYQDDGFLIIEDFYSQEELAELKPLADSDTRPNPDDIHNLLMFHGF